MTTKEWKIKHRDKVLEYGKKYRETHKEKLKLQKQRYYESNKEKWVKYNMAKKTTNVFDPSIYDSCMTETCENKTQHKSGYCEKCRTKECVSCKRIMTLSNPFYEKKPQCAYCKSKGRRLQ